MQPTRIALNKMTGTSLAIAVLVLMILGISFAQSPWMAVGRGLWGASSSVLREFLISLGAEYGKSWLDKMLQGAHNESVSPPARPPEERSYSWPPEERPSSPPSMQGNELPGIVTRGLPLRAKLGLVNSSCQIQAPQILELDVRVIQKSYGPMVVVKDANVPNSPGLEGTASSLEMLQASHTELYPNGCRQALGLQTFGPSITLDLGIQCPTPDPQIPIATCQLRWQSFS